MAEMQIPDIVGSFPATGYSWAWPEERVAFGPFTYPQAMEFARQEVANSQVDEDTSPDDALEMTEEALKAEMDLAGWELFEFTVIQDSDLATGREMLEWPAIEVGA